MLRRVGRAGRAAAPALDGIIAGIYVREVLTYPGVQRLPAREYVRYHQELDKEMARKMPIVGNATLVAGIAAVVLSQSTRERLLSGAALLCGVTEVAMTITRNVPLNREVQSWDANEPPHHWAEVRDRWMAGHRARTALSLIGLGCSIAATMDASAPRHQTMRGDDNGERSLHSTKTAQK